MFSGGDEVLVIDLEVVVIEEVDRILFVGKEDV